MRVRSVIRLLVPTLGLFFFLAIVGGCSSGLRLNSSVADAHDPEVVREFENRIEAIIEEIKVHPDYRRIPLDTRADQEWFLTQAFLFWDGKSTKEEFLAAGQERFPGFQDSFAFLAERLER